MSSIQADIEARLAVAEPDVEVLLAEIHAGTVRLFIDHPDGVSLELCERVTHALPEVREQLRARGLLAGPRAPAHEARPLSAASSAAAPASGRASPRDGHKTFTGELVGAGDDAVTIAADSGVIAIPYADIHRSNLVEE